MSPSPPLRFLILLLAGWSGMRTAMLAPAWWATPGDAGGRPAGEGARSVHAGKAERPPRRASPGRPVRPVRVASAPAVPRRPDGPAPVAIAIGADRAPVLSLDWALAPSARPARRPRSRFLPAAANGAAAAAARRWSFSAWSFLRRGDASALAAGSMLGGSQAGARLAYRLNGDPKRPLALAARLTAPVRRPAGAEAALGLDWQPSRRLPLHLLAERRQRLGREGRSAFGMTLYGGLGEVPLGRLRIEAYAQAGIVGARSRDLFADGALRLSFPLGERVRLGAGAWAAAQPGITRFDVGPQGRLRLRVEGRNVTIAADWRQRLAGNARPGSGPTLTFATDF